MSQNYKQFINLMKVDEIRGKRIVTSFFPPEDNTRVEVFAKNLPRNLDEDVIIPFFENVGAIHTFRLMLDDNNISNRGYAYLTYLRNEDATTAIRVLNGKEMLKNHRIKVTQSLNNCRIFLGGIPVIKTKDEVWHELSKKGIINIVDVIMFRSYNNRAENRGYVFVEFPSHQFAAKMRNRMMNMRLWNKEVIVDWSVPEPVVSQEEMMTVRILYIRNLDVMEPREGLKAIVESYLNPELILKVYEFKNYAFIHLATWEAALGLITYLRKHFKNTAIEVSFAKPVSEYTKPESWKRALSKTSHHIQHSHITDTWPTYPCSFRKCSLDNGIGLAQTVNQLESTPYQTLTIPNERKSTYSTEISKTFDLVSTYSTLPRQNEERKETNEWKKHMFFKESEFQRPALSKFWRKCSQDNEIGLAQTVNQLESTPSYQTLLIPNERKSTNSTEISKTSDLFSTYSTSYRQNEEGKEANEWKKHMFFKEGEFEWPDLSKLWMPVESEITLQNDDDIFNTFSKDR